MKLNMSSKRVLVDKANTVVVVAAAIGAALTIFALVGSNTLLSQRSFQSRVITQKEAALKQLEENVEETNTLVIAYKEFVARSRNVIDGDSNGIGERDGDNARLVLDAMPSKYDFPAVVTSIEKLILDLELATESIGGVDDEISQLNQSSADPEPVPIPFDFTVSGSYEPIQALVDQLYKSIRPIHINNMKFESQGGSINLKITANTYYQPEKIADIKMETVK